MSQINTIKPRMPISDTSFHAAVQRVNTQTDFKVLLERQLQTNQPLQFSKHAQERVQQRNISITPQLLTSLNDAVQAARAKGIQDMVVINPKHNNAFIVNVPNNTIITTIAEEEMKNNIFTNIDGAVLI